tara:strand:+ start:842 stop:1360 length:519 start_codon:yes stop_codon:yes gene_type:complete
MINTGKKRRIKLNRRQLRSLINKEFRRLNEGNDEEDALSYQEMLDKLLHRGDNDSFYQARELADMLDLEIQDVSQPSPVWDLKRAGKRGAVIAHGLTFEQATDPKYMMLAVDFALLQDWIYSMKFIPSESYDDSMNIINNPVPISILNAKSERTIGNVTIDYGARTINVSGR